MKNVRVKRIVEGWKGEMDRKELNNNRVIRLGFTLKVAEISGINERSCTIRAGCCYSG